MYQFGHSWTVSMRRMLVDEIATGSSFRKAAIAVEGIAPFPISRSAAIGMYRRLREQNEPGVLPVSNLGSRNPLRKNNASLRDRTAPVTVAKLHVHPTIPRAPRSPPLPARVFFMPPRPWPDRPRVEGPCSIIDLESYSCRWPVREIAPGRHEYCNQRRMPTSAWCEDHHAVAKIRKRKEEEEDDEQ
jgi:hypothetical protein